MSYNRGIVVKNTADLEMYYDLNRYPDDTLIRVMGGMAGKSKYDKPTYENRTTYPLGQLKQILGVMHQIEAGINPNWPDIAKARYVYEMLGNNITYNYNREEYKTQQPSNLSTLLSRTAICAGYSLVFKEMMDRQGIKCDYMRGVAYGQNGQEKHAWNVLQIDGKNYPIDLTWDSPKMRKGESLQYFGNHPNFAHNHIQDNDEINYHFDIMTPAELRKSDYRLYNTREQDEMLRREAERKNSQQDRENKKAILENAIISTYQKKCTMMSPEAAMDYTKRAVEELLTKARYQGFTRDGFARQNLQVALTPSDALECMADEYVNRMVNPLKKEPMPKTYPEHYLKSAVAETISAHNPGQARTAMIKFITENKTSYFTNSGQSRARTTLANNVYSVEAMNILVEEMVENTIEKNRDIEKTVTMHERNNTMLYTEKDFELAPMPKVGMFKRAAEWIKEKMKIKDKNKETKEESNVKETKVEKDDSWER